MKNKKAFTLVELLVVISIIALLMAILIPALSRAKELAKRVVCANNMKQLGYAWIMYAENNDNFLVSAWTGERASPVFKNKTMKPWVYHASNQYTVELQEQQVKKGLLYEYIKDIDCFSCPTAPKNEIRTYSIVDPMNGAQIDNAPDEVMVWNLITLKRPAERTVFADEGRPGSWEGGPSNESWTIFYKLKEWWDDIPMRHGYGTNWNFADGHVEYWMWKEKDTREQGRLAYKQNYKHGPDVSELSDLIRTQKAHWGKLGYVPPAGYGY